MPRENTTIALVATDAMLTKAQAKRLAIMAHDGLARAIYPVHTPLDGDIVFAAATCKQALADPFYAFAELARSPPMCWRAPSPAACTRRPPCSSPVRSPPGRTNSAHSLLKIEIFRATRW